MAAESSAPARIDKVRAVRAPRAGTGTLRSSLAVVIDDVSRRHRALGAVGESWGELVPRDLAARAWPGSWRRGTLTVRAADAGAAFAFDRWLRSGGEGLLRRVGVRRVRVTT